MIAVSLNIGGGVRLIKLCTQTHCKHDKDRHMTPGMRCHGSVPLSHSGNIVKRIGSHTLDLERSSGGERAESKCRKDKDLWYGPGPPAEFR